MGRRRDGKEERESWKDIPEKANKINDEVKENVIRPNMGYPWDGPRRVNWTPIGAENKGF